MTDASLLEEALCALLDRHEKARVDAAYAEAYAQHPVDEAVARSSTR